MPLQATTNVLVRLGTSFLFIEGNNILLRFLRVKDRITFLPTGSVCFTPNQGEVQVRPKATRVVIMKERVESNDNHKMIKV